MKEVVLGKWFYLLLVVSTSLAVSFPDGVITIHPAAPRVHIAAFPGERVATVRGYIRKSASNLYPKTTITSFSLKPSVDSRFFRLANGVTATLKTNLRIRRNVDDVYTLVIIGTADVPSYGRVQIPKTVNVTVTPYNRYPPEFSEKNYKFVASTNALANSYVGEIVASDADVFPYNRRLRFSVQDDAYVYLVEKRGEMRAEVFLRSQPGSRPVYETAWVFDGGTPERYDRTTISIFTTTLPMIQRFCAAVLEDRIRICWKVPYTDASVLSFIVNITAGDRQLSYNLTSHSIISYESCLSIANTSVGDADNVTTYIWSRDGAETSQRSPAFVFKLKVLSSEYQGRLSFDCLTFNVCNLIEPCENSGECQPTSSLGYRCRCVGNWIGKNCDIRDLCAEDPCQNGGSCEMRGGRVRCDCTAPYLGDRCQYLDQCAEDPCKNGGRCTTGVYGNATCVCRRMYSGDRCQFYDACQSSPCENYATCVIQNDTDFRCDCLLGFYGKRCNMINICDLVPDYCLYRGACEPYPNNTAKCRCRTGWTGSRCQNYDYCVDNVCQNNGTCSYLGQGRYHCACADGYYGERCESYDRCFDKPCLNGGDCKNTSESFVCNCTGGFYGDRCHKYDKCVEEPCQRGSICHNIGDTRYECECTEPGSYGENCEYFNSCVLGLCLNNATCTNTSRYDAYICHCDVGWTGSNCDSFNYCDVSVCDNNGSCVYLGHELYSCDCLGGYYGTRCESYNHCYDVPCQNSGSCFNTSDSYYCDCAEGSGFFGINCELYNKCVEDPCVRGACRSLRHNVYDCDCSGTPGYFGPRCEFYDGCFGNPCLHNGTCTSTSLTGGVRCDCDGGMYSGERCEKLEHCPASRTVNELGNITWPVTRSGHVAKVECEMGPNDKFIERTCLIGPNVTWSEPVDTGCLSTMWGFFTQAGETAALAELGDLKSLTSDPSSMTPEQLGKVADSLENVVQHTYKKVEIAEIMTDVVGNVLQADPETLRKGQLKDGTSNKLMSVLDQYTANVEIEQGNNVTLVSGDIKVMAVDIDVIEPNDVIALETGFGHHNSTITSQVNIPGSILANMTLNGTTRLQLLSYANNKLFVDPSPTRQDPVDFVMSVSVRGLTWNTTDDTVISYRIPSNETTERNFTCVFWDENEFTWSTAGVYVVRGDVNESICVSTHMTSFSIIMDPEPGRPLALIHERVQTYITYIGCGISLFALGLTIVTYGLFRCLHADRSGKILLNICASMFLLNIVFLLGSLDSSSYEAGLCMAVAIVMHYLILTTLCWMLIEAVNMYEVLVIVFTDYERKFLLKRLVIGWGVPAVVVAITIAVSRDNYRTKDAFCFISHASSVAFYAALLGPACLILIANTFVFARVIFVLRRPRVGGKDQSEEPVITKTQIRGAISVMVVLGVTWVFGPLAIGDAKVFFTYAFTVANSLQGFLVFLFRCAMNTEAHMAWQQLMRTGTLKKRRGVPISTTVSTSYDSNSRGKQRHIGEAVTKNTNTKKLDLNGPN